MKSIFKYLIGNKYLLKLFHMFDLETLFVYDYLKFRKYYSIDTFENKDVNQLRAWILMDKHKVEKALSLPNVRENFGFELIQRLHFNLQKYKELACVDKYYLLGVGALKAYKDYHDNLSINPTALDKIDMNIYYDFFDNEYSKKVGVSPFEFVDFKNFDFYDFVNKRVSCRNYQNKEVESGIIEYAVKCAIKTPSVCNRQHWKCHIFSGKQKENILNLQTGSTGFKECISHIAVITSDLRSFYLPSERYQPYIDGGMFAMSFIYGLHVNGVQSCVLNWSSYIMADIKIHQHIPENEVVMMIIAFGYADKSALIANSPRKDVNEVLVMN